MLFFTQSFTTVIYTLSLHDALPISVDAYPGCDGRALTCRDKFDNVLQFLGMEATPEEDPATRVSW